MANHIAEVARMLGVEIGEIFKIADNRNSFFGMDKMLPIY